MEEQKIFALSHFGKYLHRLAFRRTAPKLLKKIHLTTKDPSIKLTASSGMQRLQAGKPEWVFSMTEPSFLGDDHFGLAGALRYFSSGTSKYISSLPLASRTPVK